MAEAGMETPEFRWPTTPATLASTSFCATVVPTFGSAWSSSATSSSLTVLPSSLRPVALASSTARRAPFSLSLPRWAIPPVSGPTWPSLTTIGGGGGGGAATTGSGFFSSPHAARVSAATTANTARLNCVRCMEVSQGKCGHILSFPGGIDRAVCKPISRHTAHREARAVKQPARDLVAGGPWSKKPALGRLFVCGASGYFLVDSTHFTRALISASGTVALGGIGIWPHAPEPPFLTLAMSFASAPASPLYFAATS